LGIGDWGFDFHGHNARNSASRDGKAESRVPRIENQAKVCLEFNRLGVKKLVVGGFAVIQHGFLRNTGDIDFLIDGVPIPFASPRLLLRTKQTFREKDAEDRVFLEQEIAGANR
jgi:hypothetical protein